MPKGPNGQKRLADSVGMSVMFARIATGEEDETSYASQNRRKSGVAGAKARMEALGAERRSEIATKGAAARWKKGEKEMIDLCSAPLHSLLSSGGRELQNIKFLAGSSPTKEGMCAEAVKVIGSAIARGMPHNPPVTGRQKASL
jgi:hypothetical protein